MIVVTVDILNKTVEKDPGSYGPAQETLATAMMMLKHGFWKVDRAMVAAAS